MEVYSLVQLGGLSLISASQGNHLSVTIARIPLWGGWFHYKDNEVVFFAVCSLRTLVCYYTVDRCCLLRMVNELALQIQYGVSHISNLFEKKQDVGKTF